MSNRQPSMCIFEIAYHGTRFDPLPRVVSGRLTGTAAERERRRRKFALLMRDAPRVDSAALRDLDRPDSGMSLRTKDTA